MSIRNILSIVGLAWLAIGGFFLIIIPWIKGNDAFSNLEYSGLINEIEYRTKSLGMPYVKIDTTWHSFEIHEMKVAPYIQIGDSIVKKSK